MNVVIDVNVWVSGLLWGGMPGRVLQLAQQQVINSYVSSELLLELETTLCRNKFQSQLQKRNQTVMRLLDMTRLISTIIDIQSITVPQLRDPQDLKILATAVAANAQVLITGDQDLLVLHPFQTIAILTPSDLLETIS
jgi:uncharacterized protein